jgi:hypothetical protein
MEVEMADDTENLREEHTQFNRRRSMSGDEERQRRASIKAILADDSITPTERRRSIVHLMDGRRSSIGTSSAASSSGSVGNGVEDGNSYGYGDSNEYGYGDDGGPSARNQQSQYPDHVAFAYGGEQCVPICNENTKRAEQTRPHCDHYERKCTLVAPCCGAAFGCRICHDDSPILPPLLMMKQVRRYPRSSSLPGSFTCMAQTPEETHHNIDRFAVKEVICRDCCTKQSAKR